MVSLLLNNEIVNPFFKLRQQFMKMPILLATIFSFFLVANSQAQFKRGTLMVGTTIGSTAYSSANSDYDYVDGETKSTGTNTYSFSVGPQIGVFLSPNFVLGGTFSFSLTNSQVNSTTDDLSVTTGSKTNTTTSTFSLGPFMRYYFAGLPGKNWFYMQANGAVGSGSGSNSGNSYTASNTATTNGSVSNILTWNAGGSFGLTHFFYKRIGMDIAIGYSYSHVHNYDLNTTNTTSISTDKLTTTTNNYTLNTGTNGVTLSVGFHWFL
jgi:hypothetical protein